VFADSRSLTLQYAEGDHESVAERGARRPKGDGGDDTNFLAVEPNVGAADHPAGRVGSHMERELSPVEHADSAEDENHDGCGSDSNGREHSDAQILPAEWA